MLELICIGTALVDSVIRGFDPNPVSASGYRAESGSLHVGGEAVNVSMAAVKLGLETGIYCAVGEDEAGEMILSALGRCGVDTSPVLRPPDYHTPVTTMFVREDGTRRSVTNKAHRVNFHPESDPDRFRNARAIALGSLFRAPFDDPEIVFQVLRTAKAQGQTVFADTKLPNFRVLKPEDLLDSYPMMDFITPNEDEAAYYSGKTEPEEMADFFLNLGVQNVIIKLGSKGCYFKNNDFNLKYSACRIQPVDATGAGDNFLAGFISETLRGVPVPEALRFANACGAVCTTAAGAGTALRSREQVLDFLYYNSGTD